MLISSSAADAVSGNAELIRIETARDTLIGDNTFFNFKPFLLFK